jgi:hypothetical protein
MAQTFDAARTELHALAQRAKEIRDVLRLEIAAMESAEGKAMFTAPHRQAEVKAARQRAVDALLPLQHRARELASVVEDAKSATNLRSVMKRAPLVEMLPAEVRRTNSDFPSGFTINEEATRRNQTENTQRELLAEMRSVRLRSELREANGADLLGRFKQAVEGSDFSTLRFVVAECERRRDKNELGWGRPLQLLKSLERDGKALDGELTVTLPPADASLQAEAEQALESAAAVHRAVGEVAGGRPDLVEARAQRVRMVTEEGASAYARFVGAEAQAAKERASDAARKAAKAAAVRRVESEFAKIAAGGAIEQSAPRVA